MIYDSLDNLALYVGVNPYLGRALQFLRSPLPVLDGRYAIDGDNCYATLCRAPLRELSQAKLEVHNSYVDLQVVLAGCERFGYAVRERCSMPQGEFDAQRDILFFDDAVQNFVDVCSSTFVIFMPSDAHAPLIGRGEVRKVIIKLRVG